MDVRSHHDIPVPSPTRQKRANRRLQIRSVTGPTGRPQCATMVRNCESTGVQRPNGRVIHGQVHSQNRTPGTSSRSHSFCPVHINNVPYDEGAALRNVFLAYSPRLREKPQCYTIQYLRPLNGRHKNTTTTMSTSPDR